MSLSPSALKVQTALNAYGIQLQVIELPDSTRSAAEAAAAIGCQVAQIAKSLIFKGSASGRPLLIIASGSNRVNEKKMAAIVGEPLEKPDAGFVREQTGFAIGGIPPVGHLQPLLTFVDEDLLQYAEIWAAAGTSHAVFKLTAAELLEITQARAVQIK
jgi:prolyl-tRNA editing enzyme YbaK/EbsC (Cys-tRNA(Pro) deacylase)